jgi:hypothetical protein
MLNVVGLKAAKYYINYRDKAEWLSATLIT